MSKYKKDSLGSRMKEYEVTAQKNLIRRMPIIVRVDGRAFHSFTKNCVKPFDAKLHDAMCFAAQAMVDSIQGGTLAYTQSDEISLLIRDWDTIKTDAFYDNNLQKIVSIAAVIASNAFNWKWLGDQFVEGSRDNVWPKLKHFAQIDARAYNLPKEEVCNYFIWRQQDATRNSINMLAQSEFSHKALQGKNVSEVQDMLMLEKGINWNNCEVWQKRGSCVYRKPVEVPSTRKKNAGEMVTRNIVSIDRDIPIFTQDREFIDCHLVPDVKKRASKIVEVAGLEPEIENEEYTIKLKDEAPAVSVEELARFIAGLSEFGLENARTIARCMINGEAWSPRKINIDELSLVSDFAKQHLEIS